jgi:hypothetical protein
VELRENHGAIFGRRARSLVDHLDTCALANLLGLQSKRSPGGYERGGAGEHVPPDLTDALEIAVDMDPGNRSNGEDMLISLRASVSTLTMKLHLW